MEDQKKKNSSRSHEADSLRAIAVFLGVFGLAVCYATLQTATIQGKWTNALSGAILLICASAAGWRAYQLQKNLYKG